MKTPEQQRIDDDMHRAISAYTGPVTKCPPGTANASTVKKLTEAGLYLKEHHNDPPDAAAEARRRRVVRAKRERIAKHNEPLLERIEKRDRKTKRNMAIIKKEK